MNKRFCVCGEMNVDNVGLRAVFAYNSAFGSNCNSIKFRRRRLSSMGTNALMY